MLCRSSMINVQIGRQVISIPSVNDSPNWGQGIINAIQALAGALQFTFGPNDIPPQEFILQTNAATSVAITPLRFSVTQVRGAYVYYAIYRQTNSVSEAEIGVLETVYNPNGPTGQKWSFSRSYTGNSTVDFFIDDSGQITYSSALIAGSNFTGNILFKASVFDQSY